MDIENRRIEATEELLKRLTATPRKTESWKENNTSNNNAYARVMEEIRTRANIWRD